MNRYCFLIFLFFFILHSDSAFSQSPKADSLQNVLKTVKADTSKVNALNLLFLEYEFDDVYTDETEPPIPTKLYHFPEAY